MFAAAITQTHEVAPGFAEAEALIARCKRGDTHAFRALYDEHFEFAWRTARRLGLPEEEVEDAVQEAFHVAWQQLASFTWGRFTTWLFRIVANVVSAKLRRRRVREVFGSLWGSAAPTAHSIDGRMEARDTLQRIEFILRRLSREKREAFALHEIEGLSHEQIAELTGAKIETIRTRLFYARREFEKLARESGVEP